MWGLRAGEDITDPESVSPRRVVMKVSFLLSQENPQSKDWEHPLLALKMSQELQTARKEPVYYK